MVHIDRASVIIGAAVNIPPLIQGENQAMWGEPRAHSLEQESRKVRCVSLHIPRIICARTLLRMRRSAKKFGGRATQQTWHDDRSPSVSEREKRRET